MQLHKGQRVRLVIGPFKGRIGTIVRIETSKNEWSTWVIVGWPDGKTSQQFANELEVV
jgi:ribosomal protein L24